MKWPPPSMNRIVSGWTRSVSRLGRTRRQWIVNGVLAVLLVGVVVAGILLSGLGGAASATEATVRTSAVTTGDVTASVSADGTVQAVDEVAANFETSGTIDSLKVAVGDTVKKGQVIATLDASDLERSRDVAELQRDAAREQLDSAESSSVVDDAQVASAEANLIQARATLADARAAVTAARLKAPISGTVLEVNGKVGSSAGASSASGQPSGESAEATSSSSSSSDFVVIADLGTLQVEVSVPESDIAPLEVGQSASVSFPAREGEQATGAITSIDPAGTSSNGVVTFGVVVELSDVPDSVRLGQTASVTITTDSVTGVMVVPSTAVTGAGGGSSVTVMDSDGQQVATPVEVGVVGDLYTEIVSGVSEGDQVVLTAATDETSGDGLPGFPGGGGFGQGGPPGGGGGFGGPPGG